MIGWVDGSAGASGDMLLGAVHDALVQLGRDPSVMAEAAASVVPVDITVTHEQRGGFQVARATVIADETDPPHRRWSDIRALLGQAALDDRVHSLAAEAFERLAVAEAAVHGVTPEEIHFHEVGAHDAVGDIVGVCAGIVALGLTDLSCSPVALGGGQANTSHGTIPIPGPAVLELLRHSEIAAYGGPVEQELCTPTGATLLATLARVSAPMPEMAVRAIGVGAGSRHTGAGLGALRIVVGELAQSLAAEADPLDPAPDGSSRSQDILIETNVDDLDPRLWPAVLAKLLAAGAADAWLTPILMKKGRPAHTLHVLVARDPALRGRIQQLIVTETSAIGLRETPVAKTALARREETIDVDGQAIRVKVATHAGRVVNAQPEYDDVAAAAEALGRPAKVVLAQAISAATRPRLDPSPE